VLFMKISEAMHRDVPQISVQRVFLLCSRRDETKIGDHDVSILLVEGKH
jgi:hypothetical protein